MTPPPAAKVRHAFPPSNHESCGIDTLYLCARVRDADLTLTQLDKAIPLTNRGVSLAVLAEASTTVGLHAELLQTDLARLRRWQLPAILHVNDSHFIGFVGTTDDGRLLVFDNSVGLIECTPEWFAERYRWGGDSLVLGPVPSPWSEALLNPWVLGSGWLALMLSISGVWLKPSSAPSPPREGGAP